MSGDLTSQRLLAVYLLHWQDGTRQAQHYVGITDHSRIDARMREHQAGRGALRTAALASNGRGFALARIFTTYNRELETTLIDQGDAISKLCPVCRGATPLENYRPTKRAAGLLPPLEVERTVYAIHARPGRQP